MSRRRRSSPASPARTAATWPSCCSRRATRSTAWCAAAARSTPGASTTSATGCMLHYGDLVDQNSLVRTLGGCRSRRDLQPGRPEPRQGLLRDARVHDRRHRRSGVLRLLDARPRAAASRRASTRPAAPRCSASSRRRRRPKHALPPALAVRRGQGVRPLDRRSTTARATGCTSRTASCSTTSRRAAARTSSPARSRMGVAAIKQGRTQRAAPRQPRRQARLGLRRGLRRGDVAACCSRTSPTTTSIATGETHSVREFLEEAFAYVGLDWQKHVVVDPQVLPARRGRPAAGRPRARRARCSAGSPRSRFKELVRLMVDADMEGRRAPLRRRGRRRASRPAGAARDQLVELLLAGGGRISS